MIKSGLGMTRSRNEPRATDTTQTMQTAIPCLLMRGGTSKGPFFNEAEHNP